MVIDIDAVVMGLVTIAVCGIGFLMLFSVIAEVRNKLRPPMKIKLGAFVKIINTRYKGRYGIVVEQCPPDEGMPFNHYGVFLPSVSGTHDLEGLIPPGYDGGWYLGEGDIKEVSFIEMNEDSCPSIQPKDIHFAKMIAARNLPKTIAF